MDVSGYRLPRKRPYGTSERVRKMASQRELLTITVPETRTEFVVVENARIGERLEEMMDYYEGR